MDSKLRLKGYGLRIDNQDLRIPSCPSTFDTHVSLCPLSWTMLFEDIVKFLFLAWGRSTIFSMSAFRTTFFSGYNFCGFWNKILQTKFFFNAKFLRPTFLKRQKKFQTQNFSDQNIFQSLKFFGPKIFFGPRIIFPTKKFFGPKIFFRAKIFLDSKFFRDPQYFSIKTLFGF